MIVLVWLIEKLSTLINWLGILGWIYVFTEGDPVYVYYAIPLLIVGFILYSDFLHTTTICLRVGSG
ncbi:MAG: hypothetical protein IJA42_03215 [Bacteroidales bacterium]|nr:hypothetical protein [Bacteroidales bacterium]